MRRGLVNDSGSVTVDLPPGRHEYKFVVDGHWVIGLDNARWAFNGFGTFNSVVTVG